MGRTSEVRRRFPDAAHRGFWGGPIMLYLGIDLHLKQIIQASRREVHGQRGLVLSVTESGIQICGQPGQVNLMLPRLD